MGWFAQCLSYRFSALRVAGSMPVRYEYLYDDDDDTDYCYKK